MTAKEAMEAKRREWHVERAAHDALRQKLNDLYDEIVEAREKMEAAHQSYREAKAIWNTGKVFKTDDAKRAEMIYRLQKL